MARAPALLLSMIAFIFCVATSTVVRAQPARTQSHTQQLAHLPDIKDAIVKVIGADADKVELKHERTCIKSEILTHIEARFVPWRSKGHFDIKAEGGGHHGWEDRRHRIGVRVLLFVTSGGAGPFDGAGQRAVSADPDDPSATA